MLYEPYAKISNREKSTKLEYSNGVLTKSIIWEERDDGTVLKTTFNGEGAITAQALAKMDSKQIESEISSILSSISPKKVERQEFEEPVLSKKCPSCGSSKLVRYVEANRHADVPVMPLYVCMECKAKSYYLTDEYLEFLVDSNYNMFSDDEQREIERDKNAFLKELRAYIIRIFASKKIQSIK